MEQAAESQTTEVCAWGAKHLPRC